MEVSSLERKCRRILSFTAGLPSFYDGGLTVTVKENQCAAEIISETMSFWKPSSAWGFGRLWDHDHVLGQEQSLQERTYPTVLGFF
jgi:hypothetical protein